VPKDAYINFKFLLLCFVVEICSEFIGFIGSKRSRNSFNFKLVIVSALTFSETPLKKNRNDKIEMFIYKLSVSFDFEP
jgi:hypothetical protein